MNKFKEYLEQIVVKKKIINKSEQIKKFVESKIGKILDYCEDIEKDQLPYELDGLEVLPNIDLFEIKSMKNISDPEKIFIVRDVITNIVFLDMNPENYTQAELDENAFPDNIYYSVKLNWSINKNVYRQYIKNRKEKNIPENKFYKEFGSRKQAYLKKILILDSVIVRKK